VLLTQIIARRVCLVDATRSGDTARHERMARNLRDLRAIDHERRLRDLHRQEAAYVLPGDGIEIPQVVDAALRVHHTVRHLRRVVIVRRQREQVRALFFVHLDRRSVRFRVRSHVGHVGQPPFRHLVQVRQRPKRAAVEQIGVYEEKWALDLPLCLRPSSPARPRAVAVMRAKGEKPGIVDRLLVLVPQHHDLHAVVQAYLGNATQVFESSHVLPYRRREILRLDPMVVATPRVPEDVTEEVHPPQPLLREGDRKRRVIHLRLIPRLGFETQRRLRQRPRPQLSDPFLDDRVAAGEARFPQLLKHPLRRDVLIPVQKLPNPLFVGIQTAWTPHGQRQVRMRGTLVPLLLDGLEHRPDRIAGYSQLLRDAANRHPLTA